MFNTSNDKDNNVDDDVKDNETNLQHTLRVVQ